MLIKASNGLVADNIVEGNSIGGILLIPEMSIIPTPLLSPYNPFHPPSLLSSSLSCLLFSF